MRGTVHKNENCHIRIYKTKQWVSKFKCMCAVNVQIDSYFFKVEIYKYCIKTSFFLTEFFYLQGSMSRESEAQNIFPAAFAFMEHTPESSNLQDARGLGGFRTCFTCRK